MQSMHLIFLLIFITLLGVQLLMSIITLLSTCEFVFFTRNIVHVAYQITIYVSLFVT